MNAYQPRTAPSYGYDSPCASFQGTGAPIFSCDSSANYIPPASLEISPRHALTFCQFTGKERDAESGLDYFGARYYGSALGRWTSPDPYNAILIRQNMVAGGLPEEAASSPFNEYLGNPQNWNKYNYVRNNPLAFTDPTGAAPDGHHLIPLRNLINSPLGKSFANAIKTGPLSGNGFPNQPGFQSEHAAYNAAVEGIMQETEEVAGNRNSWSLAQWQEVASKILTSSDAAIKDFLDALEENNPGAKAALATALSSYQVPLRVAAQVALNTAAGDLANFFIIIVAPPPVMRQILKPHAECLLDRSTGACATF